ncbi:MAG: hypothetical protein NXI31_22325 [bacterium]|nr:hypothetical protein [bacterium]
MTTTDHEIEQEATDRVMHAGLQLLAARERRDGATASRPNTEHRPPTRRLLVALLAIGMTVTIAVLTDPTPARRKTQDPDGVPPSWRDELAEAPVVATRQAVDALAADTPTVRLTPPTVRMIAGLARLRHLRAVAITGPGNTPALTLAPEIVDALVRHTRIEALELDLVAVDAERLAPLERLPLLRELRLRIGSTPIPLSILPTRSLLRLAIDLRGAVPRDWQRFLARSHGLRALELDGAQAIDASRVAALGELPALTELALRHHTSIRANLVAAIADLPHLSALDLANGTLPDRGALRPLRQNKRIRRLSLARAVNLTSGDLEDVVTIANLTTLDLEHFGRTVQLDDPGKMFALHGHDPLPALRRARSLKRVSLRDVPDLKLDALRAAAAGWEHLDLRDATFVPPKGTPQGAGDLEITNAEAFRKFLAVKELIL